MREREKIETNAQTKAYVSYLDDGAQTSRGWCNPPGASPDTINRSSRPRLSRANRRCPELRSVTRTPFTAILFGLCVRVWASLSRTRKKMRHLLFSLCVCVCSSLFQLRRARVLSARWTTLPSLSLSLITTTRYSRFRCYVRFVYEARRNSHNPPQTTERLPFAL